ncbi:hypothetical protein ACFHYQ_08835 [Sphaerimonospora cavernae]|uniref:Toxin-antitoxin system n=1 Tax=Sphaerimonospora cavernae TaxID=1740611 RepID=A0ABV6U5J9_9ACTN
MAAIVGRLQRHRGAGDYTPLQTRVPVHVRDRYDLAAARRGVSLSMYLERLIEMDPLARESYDPAQKDPLI